MNAIVIAATVMASTGLDCGYITGKRYVVALTICQGDPLGTHEAGTVEIISRPQLMLTQGQTGFFQVGQQGLANQQHRGTAVRDCGIVVRTRVDPLPGGKVHLGIEYQHSEVMSRTATGSTVRETSARCHPTLELGKPTNVRLAAESATKQTWATVTVYEYRANSSVMMQKGMTWTVRGLGAGK